jgi:ubiquinone biosynthesis protein COQ4
VAGQTSESSFSSPVSRVEDGLYLSETPTLFERLKVAVKALKILEKQPDDPIAPALFNAAIDGPIFQRHAEQLAKTPEGHALLKERPTLQAHNIDLKALEQLPDGTVGRAFAKYFSDNKISPFSTPYEVRNDQDYVVKWYRETHDLHHVLTGYATDAIGEMELQAFAWGNLGLRTSQFILLVAALVRPHKLPPIWKYSDRLRDAYRRGKASKNLFSARYEQSMEKTLDQMRAELAIPPRALA